MKSKNESKDRVLYVFLDESGNFDFSKNGTKYFILSGLSCYRPFEWYSDFIDLKFNLMEKFSGIEEFHCSEDKQFVRNQVFSILSNYQKFFRVDSVIVQKNKTNPLIQNSGKLYPLILRILLSYIVRNYDKDEILKLIFITDELPVKREKEAITKGIKLHLSESFGKKPYKIFHWNSKSTIGLQAVDYVCWAIQRKWNMQDPRSYDLVKRSIQSEFDVFKSGEDEYY